MTRIKDEADVIKIEFTDAPVSSLSKINVIILSVCLSFGFILFITLFTFYCYKKSKEVNKSKRDKKRRNSVNDINNSQVHINSIRLTKRNSLNTEKRVKDFLKSKFENNDQISN
jgi:hypothetical protein